MKCVRQILKFSMLLAALSPAMCLGDTITLDDFSTGLTFAGGKFFNSSNQQVTAAGNTYTPWGGNGGGMLQVNPGITARWTDTDTTNGILGDTRSAVVTNASGISRSSISMLGGTNGVANINSPVANVMCLTCFAYSFAPIDVALRHILIINFTALDATARGNLQARMTLSDGINSAVATFSTATAVIGSNRFDLREAANWGSLNQYAVTSAMIEFTSTTNGVDFVVDGLLFSTNPEPGSFAVLALGLIAFAGIRTYRRRAEKLNEQQSD